MKILIVNNMAPFIWGGAEELAHHLMLNLIKAGHQAEVLRIPFSWEPAANIPGQINLVRSLEIANVDKVIALKFPAYLIRHPEKTIWLLHQYRQAYDLRESGNTNIPESEWGHRALDLIKGADAQVLTESKRVFCNSVVTRDRLKKFSNFEATVLLPPVNDPDLFQRKEARGYIFAGGRVNSMKRQLLLLEAMLFANPRVKLIVAGPPDSKSDAEALENFVSVNGLSSRVQLDLRFLSRKEYSDYVNHSNAVAYIPFDEDSYGYVAMEAAQAQKPIITLSDSGGVTHFVGQDKCGWVSSPTPGKIANAMNAVFENADKTKALGENAYDRLKELDLTWPSVIKRLLA